MFSNNLKEIAKENDATIKEKGNNLEIYKLIAERKVFLSKKKLEYIAKVSVDEESKTVTFTEMLKESGSGLSSGGYGDDMSPGFGFKASSYSSGMSGRSGSIEEQSKLFGKDYNYDFDYSKVRNSVKKAAEVGGYKFSYHIL